MIISRQMSGQCVSKFGRVLAPSNPYKEEDYPIVPVALDNLKIYVDPGNTLSYRPTGRVLRDLSGSGYDGSVASGNPIYRFYNGGVFEWDYAYTQYWSFGNPSDIEPSANSITILMWAYPFTNNSFETRLLRKGFGALDARIGISRFDTTWFYSADQNFSSFATRTHAVETWGMFGISYSPGSPGTATAWYNGSSIGSGNRTLVSTTDPWSIGTANAITTLTGWNGRVGLFTLYNTVLTSTQVSQWYEITRRRYGV